MNVIRNVFMRMFGRPQGILGRLGGIIMARTNEACGAWVTELLQIEAGDRLLEIGFGPGVIIERLSRVASAGYIAGVDASAEMVAQARARNETAIELGRVDLRRGTVESLPFEDNTFDKALTINSMQVWSNPETGLRELYRVLKPKGRIVLGFTPHSGQRNEGLTEKLTKAGFNQAAVVQKDRWFCALASKPGAVSNRTA